jgi:NAD(P)H-hydrate epimerase
MWRSGVPDDDDYGWADAVVCGPGWTDATVADLTALLRAAGARGLPVVLDAAGLRLASEISEPTTYGAPLVLTPHPGELAVLAGVPVEAVLSRPFAVLETVAARFSASPAPVILLKSSATICRSADGRISVIDGRCPALGVAGSGDVLAGIIGARLALTSTTQSTATNTPDGPLDGATDPVGERVLAAAMEHLLRGRQLARHAAFTAGELARWAPRWEDDPQ